MGPILVIYNPIAGRGRVRAAWPQVQKALQAAGVEFEAAATQAPQDAFRLARAAPGKYRAVVSVGGDGTTHEIVNGLMTASAEAETIPLGIIPLGSGDDFAKVLPPEAPVGGRSYEWQAAVQKIVRGETRLYDVGRMQGDHPRPELGDGPLYFMNGMDVGFGAVSTMNYYTIPVFIKGFSAYLLAILKTMIRYPLLHLTIQLDDEPPFEQSTSMTAITNGRCFGNGFWVCPEASADDGLFDVMIGDGVGRLTIMGLIPKLTKGTHIHEPVVSMRRARRVTLTSLEALVVEADGELPYMGTHHLVVDMLPRRLRVIV